MISERLFACVAMDDGTWVHSETSPDRSATSLARAEAAHPF
jgi:hypothetical protein